MVFIVIFVVYFLFIIALTFGYVRLSYSAVKRTPVVHTISVVIAYRNEAVNLPGLISDLSSINYPKEKWEVIFVNDHSMDVLPVVENVPFNVRWLSLEDEEGKKAAITTGVSASTNEIIVTTDADCRVPALWLTKINDAFSDESIRMVSGGVRITGPGFFARLQSLEFVSVAITGAATIGLGIPTMCNGASLAYRKEAFISCNGYSGNEQISSGDDEFLMNKIASRWKNSVTFLSSSDAVVSTAAASSLSSFIKQRQRWAGKWRHNSSGITRFVAILVLLLQLGFILMPVAYAFGYISRTLAVNLFAEKIVADCFLLIPASNFFGVKWRWSTFLTLQLVYPFYVLYVGITSQIVLPEWKGRAVEKKV